MDNKARDTKPVGLYHCICIALSHAQWFCVIIYSCTGWLVGLVYQCHALEESICSIVCYHDHIGICRQLFSSCLAQPAGHRCAAATRFPATGRQYTIQSYTARRQYSKLSESITRSFSKFFYPALSLGSEGHAAMVCSGGKYSGIVY